MESDVFAFFRYKQSSTSDRFLGVFSSKTHDASNLDFDEHEIFSTGEKKWKDTRKCCNRRRTIASRDPGPKDFRFRSGNFGILAALSDDMKPILYRTAKVSSTSNSIQIPANSKIQTHNSLSKPIIVGNMNQSAPVNVPLPFGLNKRRISSFIDEKNDDDAEDNVLPPHEIVARGSAKSQIMTFSVLEGTGRTLKGRDLRRVRNSALQKTGFLD